MGEKLQKITLNQVLLVTVLVFALVLLIGGQIAWNYVSSPGNSGLYSVKGVDVSRYQGDIDFKALNKEGYTFAYIKATEGSSMVDENFKVNWRNIHWSGVAGGAYHFLSYDSSGKKQAKNFIDTVGRRFGALPPAVDVEFYGDYETNNPSKKKMYKVLDPLLEELEKKYHKKPVIYTNKSIYEKYISGRYDDYPIWISDWKVSKSMVDDKAWTFCQYSFEGRSDSISNGEVDVDLDVFRGNIIDLFKYRYFDRF